MAVTKEGLKNWFTYHSPSPFHIARSKRLMSEIPTADQAPRYILIREKALEFAQTVIDNTPGSADQTAAIRKIREAVMTANAAIACAGVD